jgi:hypothetical protein
MKLARTLAALLALSIPAVSLTANAAPNKDHPAKSSKKKAQPAPDKSKDGSKKK